MKQWIITFLVALLMGYVWGNFGNVSDVSADWMPNKYDYHSRSHNHGDSEDEYETRGMEYRGRNSSYDYRGRNSDNTYEYRGRNSDNTNEYRGRGDSGDDQENMEYRGRSSRTGRFVSR